MWLVEMVVVAMTLSMGGGGDGVCEGVGGEDGVGGGDGVVGGDGEVGDGEGRNGDQFGIVTSEMVTVMKLD